ncbi:MAG TPA: hypothetical protein H9740_01105 [Candidatus Hungatella pullicola]|nr:hypothetical protein [Candidatus Hungatella pullicola]
MTILKGILTISSLAGYCIFAKEKTDIRKEFIPLAAFSAVSLILYFGGLGGMLLPAAAAVFVIGISLCMYKLCRFRRDGIFYGKPEIFEICFFAVGGMFFLLSFFLKMQHYDNFSHWAVIVKNMVTTNGFPAMSDDMVAFKDYPTGMSVFIYYICRFWGHSQGIMLAAQNLILLSAFLAIFGMVRERRRFLVYTFLAMGFSITSYLNLTIRINNLLVDFHMPIISLAAIAMIDCYEEDIKKTAFLLVPVLGFLMIIKNTGMIFTLFPVCYLVYVLVKNRAFWKKAGYFILILVLALMPGLLWSRHMDQNLSGFEQKFSSQSQSEEYASADESQREEIAVKFLEEATDLSGRAAVSFCLWNGAALSVCLYVLLRKKKWLKLFTALLVLDLVTVLYYGGILYLYLYRMPAAEAVILAGFERYACSIMVFFAGGLIIAAAKDIEAAFYIKNVQGSTYRAFLSPVTKQRYQSAVLTTVIILFNFLYSEMTGLLETRMQYSDSIAGRVEQLVGDRWYDKEDSSRYLVLGTDEDGKITNHQLSYTMKYFLYASKVDTMEAMPVNDLEKILGNYDLVIIFDKAAVYGKQEAVQVIQQKEIWKSEELREILQKI